MKRLLILIALLTLPSLAAAQNATVTGHMILANGNPPANGKICFSLQNFKPNLPRQTGGVVVTNTSFCTNVSTVDGSFSTLLARNDTLTPVGTYWRVDYMSNGLQTASATFLVNASPFNLDTQAPLSTLPIAGPNQTVVQAYVCTVNVAATTWTCVHNFNDLNVMVWVSDATGKQIIPDTVVKTDVNTVTITFNTTQAGTAVIMHAGGISIATNQPNAVIQNPLGGQTISGGSLSVPNGFVGNLTGNVTGNVTGNATTATTASNTLNVCNGQLFIVGNGCYSSFSAALTQCQSAGSCVIDARGAPSITTIGTFDPNINATSSAVVTLLLGPYTYSVTQIVLRSELQIYGVGPTNPSGAVSTVLQQANPSIAPIALPTSGGPTTTVVQGARISGFALMPAVSSTSDGISLIASANTICSPQPSCQVTATGGGLWYSTFDHIIISGFGRNQIRIDGSLCGSCSAVQFASFRDVWAYRGINAPPVLYITGSYIGQTTFEDTEFDLNFGSTDTTANLENIHIDNTAGVGATCPGSPSCFRPYSMTFLNTTIQSANGPGGIGIHVIGAINITCDNCHFEHDTIVASVTGGAWGTVIENSYIDGFSGSGGLINIDSGSSLSFHDNTEGTNPPSGGFLVSGSVPTFLQWYGNINSIGGASFSPLPEPTVTIAQLPPVADAVGVKRLVSDSTAIASEGQVCTHAASSPVTAIAISNGTNWKCF